MYNAVKKTYRAAILTTALAALAACGGGDNTGTGADSAQSLARQACDACDKGDYELADRLIDSLNATYPQAVEARRTVTAIMPRVKLGCVEAMIPEADAALAAASALVDSLEATVVEVRTDDDRYWRAATAAGSPIEPRYDDEYKSYYIVARNNGRRLGLNSVMLKSAGGEYNTTPVAPGSDRLVDLDGGEAVVIMYDEVTMLGRWATEQAPVTEAWFVGTGGMRDARLSRQQLDAFATVWAYAQAREALRDASIEREKLEHMLMTARSQCAQSADAR